MPRFGKRDEINEELTEAIEGRLRVSPPVRFRSGETVYAVLQALQALGYTFMYDDDYDDAMYDARRDGAYEESRLHDCDDRYED